MIYAVRLMTRGIGQAWEHTWRASEDRVGVRLKSDPYAVSRTG